MQPASFCREECVRGDAMCYLPLTPVLQLKAGRVCLGITGETSAAERGCGAAAWQSRAAAACSGFCSASTSEAEVGVGWVVGF